MGRLEVEEAENNIYFRYWHRSINPKKLIEVNIKIYLNTNTEITFLGEILSPLAEHDHAEAFEALQAARGDKGNFDL